MRSEASLKQYYVAVGTCDGKLATLVDMLLALRDDRPLTLAVCCCSRDSLDAVAAGLGAAKRFKVFPLFADLDEAERSLVLQKFLSSQESGGDNLQGSNSTAPTADGDHRPSGRSQASVLVVTDAVLKATRPSLGLELMVHYDPPANKDDYSSRVSTLFGSGRECGGLHVSISFVMAGEVEQFRTLEQFSSQPIEVMPIQVSDIFGGPAV